MKIHEYQAKRIFKTYGGVVPEGKVAFSVDEVREIVKGFDGGKVVLKAQIHSGGRGKAGGVKVVESEHDAKEFAKELFGKRLVTKQTGAEGKEVKRILVERGVDIKKELYLGMVIDRRKAKICIMASKEGGMEIEELALKSPEKIVKEYVDPTYGLFEYIPLRLANKLELDKKYLRRFGEIVKIMYRIFVEKDCSLMEINPLAITWDDRLLALDLKMNFDDNALFRHNDILELRDFNEENEMEVEASRFNVNYIKLNGNVGCMVNGAGLAMATMDMIKNVGGEPANFLDVGGSANSEAVANAFRIISHDQNVKSILINIFGGIVRGDKIAQGILDATKMFELKIPVVIRLQGTNAEEGKKILEKSELSFFVADNLKDAAEKAVFLAKGGKK